MVHCRLLLFLLPTLAGCAMREGAADQWIDRSSWSYEPGTPGAPIAVFGEPNTGGGLSLECLVSQNALQLVVTDAEITADGPVEVRVGNASYATIERLDPPDGFAVSRITIPLGEDILASFAQGAGPMTIHARDSSWPLPHGPEPVRMAADCIQLGSDAERIE